MSAGLTEGNATDQESGSAAALNADAIVAVDVNDFQSAYIQITGTFVGTLTFQGSNDNVNFVSVQARDISQLAGAPVTTTAAPGIFYLPTPFRFFRIRMTAYTSGTATANAFFQRIPSDDLGAKRALVHDSSGNGITSTTVLGKQAMDVNAQLSSGQLVPTITNKFRIRYAIADVTLPNTNAFQTIYTRSGTGLFFGMQLGFDNANVTIRITIDGGQVFSLPLNDVKTFEFNDTTDGRTQMGGFLTSIGNVFDFSSRYAIPYTSTILVEAASNNGAAHKLQRYMMIQTEDT